MPPPSTVDARAEIRAFLASRRARLSPASVGIPDLGSSRRTPGLRREEVAVLAGISAPYYARLERGDLVHASADVVDAVARALRLDRDERSYVADLTSWGRRRHRRDEPGASPPSPDRGRPPAALVDLLGAMTDAAGFIFNDHEEVLAANPLGHALAAPLFTGRQDGNFARWVFLDPAAPDFFADSWTRAAQKASATLRAALARDPGDARLARLIEELSRGSQPFRRLWEERDVAAQVAERRRYHHPVVGRIELDFTRLDVRQDPRLMVLTLGAAPGSAAARTLSALRDDARTS